MIDKDSLRKKVRVQRQQYHATIVQSDIDDQIYQRWQLLSQEFDVNNRIIAGYKAQGSELNIDKLLALLSTTNTITYPLYNQIGFGIEPDIILVPLLAFDNEGHRLGQGQGYYDLALYNLKKFKKIIAVGIGYECQKLDKIPVCDKDYTLDYVLTPITIIRVKK